MDADDIAVRDRLMWQVEFMERHAEVGLLGGAVEYIDGTGRTLRTVRLPLQNAEIKDALLSNQIPFINPSLVMRKEAFTLLGGYRDAFVRQAEDYDLWLRMAERYELANLKAVVLKYRLHPDQVTYQYVEQQVIAGLVARVSAALRRKGLPDPVNSAKEINPALLVELGVTDQAIANELLMRYQDQIILALRMRFDVPILALVDRGLTKLRESRHVQDSVAGAVWFTAARVYMRQYMLMEAVAAATRALLIHPALPVDLARWGLHRLVQGVRQVAGRFQGTA
jgi:hypothetical protein